ncbi:hypothetical protein, partial [Thiolapillus sp.]|uniref:hypothetical protein n=1 Tax=Thiolapillus sp. TaxID=2017437 RepID=UPI003AF8761A
EMFHVEQWRTSKVIHKQENLQGNPHSKQENPHSWGGSTRALLLIFNEKNERKNCKKETTTVK